MKIYNALQLKNGAKTKANRLYNVSQPLQFIPGKEKDQEWAAWNMDWLEWQGLKDIRSNARRLMKNYKLAKGIIDKTDYIVEEDNEMRDLVQQLADDEPGALELKFYPIIPNVINVLVSEFAKRDKKVSFRALDEYTYNEIKEGKRSQIENILVKTAEAKLINKMIEAGADPNDPEIAQQLQQQTSLENLKTLPEIEDFFNKSYEVVAEKWAAKQYKIDYERFHMDELEERGFRDSLITDREFWHFRMLEDDYDIELWNPALTFYHKSPDVRYISQGNWVGKIEMMTASDIIDKYGWLMTKDQMDSLQYHYPIQAAGIANSGYQNDGTFYDSTRSHEFNVGAPSLAYRQYTSVRDNFANNGNDIIEWVLGESEDYLDQGSANMLRVTQSYWKSQMMVGHLTKVDNLTGKTSGAIITEDYKVTDKPIYNTQLIKNKDKRNLIQGEHIEWIWINQVWGGLKIGPNQPSYFGVENEKGLNPIYLGINQNEIRPLKFQFKGDKNLYGCKLPVEGRVFSDRNTRSTSLVDLMRPHQVGFNMVNNQIADILVDEIGTVIMLDQNALPRHSLGEDWGKGNYAKAYAAMKDFSVLPLDGSIANMENASQFSHFQQIDLSQTNRLMSRIQLANYFKQEAFSVVGVGPQRMGQQMGQYSTATQVEQEVSGSYAQTEMYFVQHSDHLMPRIHQMRTDLAQHYFSTNPSVRMQMTTSNDERVNFEINGTDLLLRDINVYCTTRANHRAIIEKMRSIAEQKSASGGESIYDLGKIIEAGSMGELNSAMKGIEAKQTAQRQEQMAHQQKMKEMEMQQAEKEKAMELDHEVREAEKERRKDILVAEIRAAGYGAMQDFNENKQSDFQDVMVDLKKSDEFQQTMSLSREKENTRRTQQAEKIGLEQQKMNLQRELKDKDLEIARENKNQYDVKTSKDKK